MGGKIIGFIGAVIALIFIILGEILEFIIEMAMWIFSFVMVILIGIVHIFSKEKVNDRNGNHK